MADIFKPNPASVPATANDDKRKRFLSLRDQLVKSKDQITAALPKHMNADRLIRVALTTYNKTPELQRCTITSLLQSCMEAAQLGLEPDGLLGHAYLVPYGDKATLIPGYKGLIALAYRSGMVESLSGHAVHEKDHFEFELGLNEKLVHVPSSEDDPGATTHCYAVCRMKDGGHAMIVLSRAQVEKFRARSASKNSPAWKNDWDAMGVKTCVRQLAKWIPQAVELQRAAGREDAIDLGLDIDPDDDDSIDITGEPVEDNAPKTVAEKVSRANADPPKTSGSKGQFGTDVEPPPDEDEPGSRG